MPTTLDNFIAQMEELYDLTGGQEDHIMDSMKLIAKAVEEDGSEVEFRTFRLGACPPVFFRSSYPKSSHRLGQCYRLDYLGARSLPANFAVLGDAMMRTCLKHLTRGDLISSSAQASIPHSDKG